MTERQKQILLEAAVVAVAAVAALIVIAVAASAAEAATFRSPDRTIAWDLTSADITAVEIEAKCEGGEWELVAMLDITPENQQTSLPVTFCSATGATHFTVQVRHRFYDELGPGEWCESEIAIIDTEPPACATPRIE